MSLISDVIGDWNGAAPLKVQVLIIDITFKNDSIIKKESIMKNEILFYIRNMRYDFPIDIINVRIINVILANRIVTSFAFTFWKQ